MPNTKLTLYFLTKTFNILPKWLNFAQSGHTGYYLPSASVGLFHKENGTAEGSVCGSVGRVVALDTRGPQFESIHWQILYGTLVYRSTVMKRRK